MFEIFYLLLWIISDSDQSLRKLIQYSLLKLYTQAKSLRIGCLIETPSIGHRLARNIYDESNLYLWYHIEKKLFLQTEQTNEQGHLYVVKSVPGKNYYFFKFNLLFDNILDDFSSHLFVVCFYFASYLSTNTR